MSSTNMTSPLQTPEINDNPLEIDWLSTTDLSEIDALFDEFVTETVEANFEEPSQDTEQHADPPNRQHPSENPTLQPIKMESQTVPSTPRNFDVPRNDHLSEITKPLCIDLTDEDETEMEIGSNPSAQSANDGNTEPHTVPDTQRDFDIPKDGHSSETTEPLYVDLTEDEPEVDVGSQPSGRPASNEACSQTMTPPSEFLITFHGEI
jgi:hypothetical protein